MQVLIHETDSMVTAMREKKLFELEKVQTKYSGKTQTLRIKRLWLNSETMPWTYSSWKQVEYNISVSGYISRGSFFKSEEHQSTPSGIGFVNPIARRTRSALIVSVFPVCTRFIRPVSGSFFHSTVSTSTSLTRPSASGMKRRVSRSHRRSQPSR